MHIGLLWWGLVGCGPEPSGLGFPVDVESQEAEIRSAIQGNSSGFWPYGIQGGGHPEGHRGWDMDAGEGVEILAVGDATVTRADSCDASRSPCSFGHFVMLRLTDSRGTVGYHHTGPPLVEEGDEVAQGDVIATFVAYEDVPVIHFDLAVGVNKVCPEPFLSEAGVAAARWYLSQSTPNPEHEDPAYIGEDGRYSQLCFEVD